MYYVVYVLVYLFSLLPWWVVYGISDGLYLIAYYGVQYRRKVVMDNLLRAFPEKSEQERMAIAKEFYHTLIDTFLEMLKLFSISRKELDKRVVANYTELNELYNTTGQSIQLHGGHFFNWEFMNLALAANLKYSLIGVYTEIQNKIFNRLFIHMRGRFGSKMVSTKEFRNKFHALSKEPYALGLAADQNPSQTSNAYWLSFFGKMVPFARGPERGAVSQNAAVIFASFYRVKRGFYQLDLQLYTTEPAKLPKGQITHDYRNFLENQIRLRPANYLWSHRRWRWDFDPAKHTELLVEAE